MRRIATAAAALLLTTATAWAQGAPDATAAMKDAQGKDLGTVTFHQHPHGVVIRGELDGLPAGWHALHIHAVGTCAPNFAAAGGHFNPAGGKHGLGAEPAHAGDLPNFYADDHGHARFEMLNERVTLAGGPTSLFDADGSSLVVHAKTDDYATDPAGNSGDRVACGVITK